MDIKSLMQSGFMSSDHLSHPCLEGLDSKPVPLYLGEEDGHMLAAARFLMQLSVLVCIREGTGLGASG